MISFNFISCLLFFLIGEGNFFFSQKVGDDHFGENKERSEGEKSRP